MGSIGKKSYMNKLLDYNYSTTQEYQKPLDEVRNVREQLEALKEYRHSLDQQLDKEVVLIGGLNKSLSAALGSYTTKGKEIEAELKEVNRQIKPLQERYDKAHNTLEGIDAREAKKELANWKEPELKLATQKSYKGFEMDTHTPYLQDYLAKGQAMIVEMSPKEYLQRVSYDIFGSSMTRAMRGISSRNAERYAREMKSGTKFYMPSLNYKDAQQEGRHRAVAAYINGYKKIPVLVVPKERHR